MREAALVLCVHGLWMGSGAMTFVARRLRARGWDTRLIGYPTVELGVPDNAAMLARRVRLESERYSKVHIVAHSLGGMVSLYMMEHHPDLPLGQLVALGSPFRGSRIAQRLARTSMGRRLLGESWPNALDGNYPYVVPTGRTVGVIAGTLSVGANLLFWGLPQPNDGTVCVDETRIPGLTDHMTHRATHMGLLVSPAVGNQVASFIQEGHFYTTNSVKQNMDHP
jgi:pimeloyl-ACP methyl ester carboxylesterase